MDCPADNRHRCDKCGGENAIFIEGERNLCRWCARINPNHRTALNVIKDAGLIYGRNSDEDQQQVRPESAGVDTTNDRRRVGGEVHQEWTLDGEVT
jgi:hypothetical protein